jgi:hypothetical protein
MADPRFSQEVEADIAAAANVRIRTRDHGEIECLSASEMIAA